MEYRPMWPTRPQKIPCLPLGVYIDYDPGDEDVLIHLLEFLRLHFDLTEKDFEETIGDDEERFPALWVDGSSVPFKVLLRESGHLEETAYRWITLGFYHQHQLVFRAYQKHLEQDGSAKVLKEFFADIEADYFGAPPGIH